MRPGRRSPGWVGRLWWAGCLLAVAAPAAAQGIDRLLAEATVLERAGRYEEAAARYRLVLEAEPANRQALLGLERIWEPLGSLDSLVPLVRGALAAGVLDPAIQALELRIWAALDQPDSLAAAVRRWGRLADPGWSAGAGGSLAGAPDSAQGEILGVLLGPRADSSSRLLAAELLARWGRTDEAWAVLDAALPADQRLARLWLERFVERAQRQAFEGPAGRRKALALALALERLAALSGPLGGARLKLEAAQAYAAAGDVTAAVRLLEGASGEPASRAGLGAAAAALVRALAERGNPLEAERRLAASAGWLDGDTREELGRAIAASWLEQGELDRAEAALGADSGTAALALRGWVAVYRGELAQARRLFRDAGPSAGSREEATRRIGVLVLLERSGVERLPELGGALRELARGDTARAVGGLEQAARRLPARGGRAGVLGLAGALALSRRDYRSAELLLGAALAADSAGPEAATVELSLANLYVATGRPAAALGQLEHLILVHPESAVVPEARRLMDRVRSVRGSAP